MTGGLSGLGRGFVAGVAEHLPALPALTVPSHNSFRRLAPSSWASNTTAWGDDNREAALRVASPFYRREEATYNLEYKVSDGSANAYLSLGALIACGLDGILRVCSRGSPASTTRRRCHRRSSSAATYARCAATSPSRPTGSP